MADANRAWGPGRWWLVLTGLLRRRPSLYGQSCDRLRPSFIRRGLEKALRAQIGSDASLIEWSWDSLRQRVNGVLLQNNELRNFRWSPVGNRLELRAAIARLEPRYPGPVPPAWKQPRRRGLG